MTSFKTRLLEPDSRSELAVRLFKEPKTTMKLLTITVLLGLLAVVFTAEEVAIEDCPAVMKDYKCRTELSNYLQGCADKVKEFKVCKCTGRCEGPIGDNCEYKCVTTAAQGQQDNGGGLGPDAGLVNEEREAKANEEPSPTSTSTAAGAGGEAGGEPPAEPPAQPVE